MENQTTYYAQNHQSYAKDFFLHLASQVALYTIVINLGNLLFKIINKIYPKVDSYSYLTFYSDSSISFPVALLIIVFPVFVLLNYLIEKSFLKDPEKKNIWIRKWLTYLTLFISGAILIGDLVTVLYYFLDGQELTIGFLLKVLTVLVISFSVFMYYLSDIREKNSTSMKKKALLISSIVIICSIVLGFSVLGSPKTQRLLKYDEAKINDLMSIGSSIQSFYDVNKRLPKTLGEINNYYINLLDNQTNTPYIYETIDSNKYKLCAVFNLKFESNYDTKVKVMPAEDPYAKNISWSHPQGNYCFDREVSIIKNYPEVLPTIIR